MAEKSIAERLPAILRQIATFGAVTPEDVEMIKRAADEIDRLTKERDDAREALEPFALAWDVATRNDAVFLKLSMGQIGALAAREVSGVHFRNVRALLWEAERRLEHAEREQINANPLVRSVRKLNKRPVE